MRYFYLLLLVSCLCTPARAQMWEKAYGTAARTERNTLVVEVPGPTGGYLLAGQQLLPNTAIRSQVYLVRTNGLGDTLWTRRFAPPLSLQPRPSGLAIDAQGNVILAVSSVTASPVPASHLIKFNPTCDTIRWQNFYQPVYPPTASGGASSIGSVYVAPGGNIQFIQFDSYFAGQTNHLASSVVKVDAATGSPLWRFDLSQYAANAGFDPRVQAYGFVPYPGGVMLYLHLFVPNATTYGYGEYLFINAAGTVARSKRGRITFNSADSFPVFCALRDGNVAVARRQKIYKISTAPATAGDTLWHTTIPPTYQYREWDARAMTEDIDGNILLVGDSYMAIPNQGYYNQQVHVVRFTGRGTYNTDLLFSRNGDNVATSVLLGPSGYDVLFGSYTTQGPIGGGDMLLTGYTGLRRLLSSSPGAARPAVLTTYPNPAPAYTGAWAKLPDGRGGELRVLDALGRVVAQQAVAAGQQTVSVAVLEPGVYVLRFVPAGGGPPHTARLLRE